MGIPEKEFVEHDGTALPAESIMDGDISGETLSPEEDKRLLRRIDAWLLPVCALSYLFQFLDKTSLGSTAILGIREDLQLKGQEYSWASGIYYFGYLVASYPAALLMIRLKVGKTITASIFLWGAVLMLTATCFNASGLLANRFFLGVTESVIAPGLTVVVSMWYKRSEQPLRHAAWFLGNTCAGIFGGLLAYAISHVDGIKPWKAVFVIFGALTVSWSVGTFFLLPDSPMEARFLNPDDRRKAVLRVKENMTGIKNDKIKWGQVREAFLDVKTWLLIAYQLSDNIPNGGITTFQSIVVKGFGFSTVETLLLGSLPYVLQLVLVVFGTTGSTYIENSRTYFMAFNTAISIAGAAMVRYLPEDMQWARFAGVVLQPAFAANFPLLMSLMSGNFGGFTKKTTINALSFIAYCLGNIIGPQLFFEREAPTYQSSFLAILICLIVEFAMCWIIRGYLIWENDRRDKRTTASDVAAFEAARHGVMVNLTDMTDKEIPQFRYVY